MRLVIATIAIAASFSSHAGDESKNESFARDMISCAYKHSIFALGPGDATVAQHASEESQTYLLAAAKATSEDFVKVESTSIKARAQNDVFAAMNNAKDVDGIVAAWKETKSTCDKQFASFQRAGER